MRIENELMPLQPGARPASRLHPRSSVPASGSHRAELLLSGCLAAWVEVAEEAAGGPEHQQRGPEAVVQQGEDARGPEEAWRTGLRAAN